MKICWCLLQCGGVFYVQNRHISMHTHKQNAHTHSIFLAQVSTSKMSKLDKIYKMVSLLSLLHEQAGRGNSPRRGCQYRQKQQVRVVLRDTKVEMKALGTQGTCRDCHDLLSSYKTGSLHHQLKASRNISCQFISHAGALLLP